MFPRKPFIVGAIGMAAVVLYGISLSAQAPSSVVLVIHEVSDLPPEPVVTAADAPLSAPELIKPTTAAGPQSAGPELRDVAVSVASTPSLVSPAAESDGSRPAPQQNVPAPSANPVAASTDGDVETVTDRFANGTVRAERQVALNADKNYVNHGSYVQYDDSGAIVVRGHYRMGKMDGTWSRQFSPSEEKIFVSALPGGVKGLLVAEATFDENGALHGAWAIKTQDQKQLAEWHFEHGIRHGTSTWWHANGQKQAELNYANGQPVGELVEWDDNGKQTHSLQFVDGRMVTRVVKWYSPGKKAYEGFYLRQQNLGEPSPDWWTGAKVEAGKEPIEGEALRLRHGLWISYYPNGQKQVQGEFRNDQPVGKFIWWHENGQRQAQGEYVNGVQNGTWITWYSNGQRESKMDYQQGDLMGQTMRWKADGTLADIQDFQDAPKNAQNTAGKTQMPRKAARVMPIATF